LLSGLVLLIGLVVVYSNKSGVNKYVAKNASQEKNLITKGIEQDTDLDNLLDWEETLWNTDPNEADTDRDGTSDGQEVASARDPLKPGPGDVLAKSEDLKAEPYSYNFNSELSENVTESLAFNLLTNYFGARDNGPLSENKKTELGNSLIGSLDDKLTLVAKSFSRPDLNIASVSHRVYINELAVILGSNQGAVGTELTLIKNALENDRSEDLVELRPIAKTYSKTSILASKIQTPSDLAPEHLLLVNSYAEAGQALLDIANRTDDPLFVLGRLGQYRAAIIKMGDVFDKLSVLATSEGLLFGPKEPGLAIVAK